LAPLDGLSFTTTTGARLEYCGPPAIEEIFESQLARFRYDSLITGEGLVPLLRVAAATLGTMQVVGGYRRLGLGLVCALTGAQLFTLVMQARENPTLKTEIVNELVATNGVLARGKNWSDYLEKVS
jgi:hypothetical protein